MLISLQIAQIYHFQNRAMLITGPLIDRKTLMQIKQITRIGSQITEGLGPYLKNIGRLTRNLTVYKAQGTDSSSNSHK